MRELLAGGGPDHLGQGLQDLPFGVIYVLQLVDQQDVQRG